MIVKLKPYLGTNHFEVHNTYNERPNCQLDEILDRYRRWYDSLAEAKTDEPYDNCRWCLGGSLR